MQMKMKYIIHNKLNILFKFLSFILIVLIIHFGCGSREKRFLFDGRITYPTGEVYKGSTFTFEARISTNVPNPTYTYKWELFYISKENIEILLNDSNVEKYTTTFGRRGYHKIKLTVTTNNSNPRFIEERFTILAYLPVLIVTFPTGGTYELLINENTGKTTMPNIKFLGNIKADWEDINDSQFIWKIDAKDTTTSVKAWPLVQSDSLHYIATTDNINVEWSPNFNNIVGGDELSVYFYMTPTLFLHKNYYSEPVIINIKGKNPKYEFILNRLGDVSSDVSPLPKLYKAICYEETTFNRMQQFDSIGKPVIGRVLTGIRVGLMGIQNVFIVEPDMNERYTITNEEIWDWEKNIIAGKAIYNLRLAQAKITHTKYPDPDGPGPKQAATQLKETSPITYALTKEALSLYYSNKSYWKWNYNSNSWEQDTSSNSEGITYADSVVNTAENPPFSIPPW